MALSRHHAASSKPLSIKELGSQAGQFDFSPNVALQRWIRAARMLLTEAALCEQDGNLQMAYLYLVRHADLVLERLPRHPDYRDPHFKQDISEAQRAVQKNFHKLDAWRPEIMRDYERYESAMDRRNAEKQRVQREREVTRQSADQSRRRSGAFDDDVDHLFDDGGRSLNAGEHSALAVDLAHRELRRRDAARQSTRQAGISPGTVASRRKGTVEIEADRAQHDDSRSYERYDDQDPGVRDAGRYLRNEQNGRYVRNERNQSRGALIPARRTASSHTYSYPSVPAKEEAMDWRMPSLQPSNARGSNDSRPPALPAKDIYGSFMPPLPRKTTASPYPRSATATPSPPLSTYDSSAYTFKSSATTEAGEPLRTVMLPTSLRPTFLNLAHPNTARNLETCGILCGTVIANALFINHLIIPDQQSSSDTCDTTPEGDAALFDFCDSKDLLVCGWIHTHPTQSCFLSSRDLHTSSGYQIMMPEAIAIVCAPRHTPEWGVFRLTAPPGLQAVLGCRQQGTFHPHAETDLYTDALRPGHVVEGKGLEFEVVDLRKAVN